MLLQLASFVILRIKFFCSTTWLTWNRYGLACFWSQLSFCFSGATRMFCFAVSRHCACSLRIAEVFGSSRVWHTSSGEAFCSSTSIGRVALRPNISLNRVKLVDSWRDVLYANKQLSSTHSRLPSWLTQTSLACSAEFD